MGISPSSDQRIHFTEQPPPTNFLFLIPSKLFFFCDNNVDTIDVNRMLGETWEAGKVVMEQWVEPHVKGCIHVAHTINGIVLLVDEIVIRLLYFLFLLEGNSVTSLRINGSIMYL